MRVSKNKIHISLKKEIFQTFLQTIEDLETTEEKRLFFEAFFNEMELETYTKRLAIAYYLKKGRSYKNIKDNLKVSSATIASVDKNINMPGMRIALKKMEAEEWANVWQDKISKIANLKGKLPI